MTSLLLARPPHNHKWLFFWTVAWPQSDNDVYLIIYHYTIIESSSFYIKSAIKIDEYGV